MFLTDSPEVFGNVKQIMRGRGMRGNFLCYTDKSRSHVHGDRFDRGRAVLAACWSLTAFAQAGGAVKKSKFTAGFLKREIGVYVALQQKIEALKADLVSAKAST
jgi:hypothetical protein